MVDNLTRTKLLTSSVTPTRLGLAEPTRLPTNKPRAIDTFDKKGNLLGSIVVDGKFGQTHEDLIEVVCFSAKQFRVFKGRLEVIVDPYVVRRAMANKEKAVTKYAPKYSATGIDQLENDIKKTMIQLVDTKERVSIKTKTSIVDKIITAEQVIDRDPYLAKQLTCSFKNFEGKMVTRSLQMWVFSEEYTELLQKDIPQFHDPRPLCRIKSGSVAAMARYVLTHQFMPRSGWTNETLLVAAKISRQASKVRHETEIYKDELLKLGINVKDGRWLFAAHAPNSAAHAPDLATHAPDLATHAPD